MRKNFGAKPILYPQPVFIIATYNSDGTANAMNAAWGGISEENEISMCISAGHKTTKNVLERKAFTVSMATAQKHLQEDGNKLQYQVFQFEELFVEGKTAEFLQGVPILEKELQFHQDLKLF